MNELEPCYRCHELVYYVMASGFYIIVEPEATLQNDEVVFKLHNCKLDLSFIDE